VDREMFFTTIFKHNDHKKLRFTCELKKNGYEDLTTSMNYKAILPLAVTSPIH
jgi:hypothetical protein